VTVKLTLADFKARIGVPWAPFIYPIEQGMVRHFVEAVGDSNPRWLDKEAVIPPTLLPTLGFEQVISTMLGMSGAVLHGSTELECYLPVRVGDTISVIATVTAIRERGNLAFISLEKTYSNQRAEVVAVCRQLAILKQEAA
jgi:acyl dehydratase